MMRHAGSVASAAALLLVACGAFAPVPRLQTVPSRLMAGGAYTADVPYAEACYDAAAAESYFAARPLESLGRLLELARVSGGFVANVVLDKKLGREAATAARRSDELLDVVTRLGTTSIKVGQALSIRSDLVPAAYVAGLTQLQDSVAPFPAAEGRRIIEDELGISVDETFSFFSTEPVASASIGQVYRARLRSTGEEVALKVQRPKVLREVALDVYLLRRLAPTWAKMTESNTDLVALVDAWGAGFIDELDYEKEAAATAAFSEAMAARGLNSVFAPEVVEDLSSKHVLTTKWVDGERLSTSDATDVPRLCGVALNAYLTMLLDTGALHCDPHPGNLLRTKDGRLCILDFGMCLDVRPDLQLSLLEFIADLSADEYERVPDDLVKLGFVPEDKIDDLRSSGLTYGISTMLKLAAEGGGPKGAMQRMVQQNKEKYADALAEFDDLDSPEATKKRQALFREDWKKNQAEDAMGRTSSTTADITSKIEELQQQNSNVFAIPEYFLYMSRAFATLEGIGLSSDENYAILKECFPYLAKRLLSDDSPRARGALRTLLYGADGTELKLDKLRDVADGLTSYSSSTVSVASGRGESDAGLAAARDQIVDVVFGEEGSFVQDLILREAAVGLDAKVREALNRPFAPLARLPALGADLLPLAPALPLELLRAAAEVNELDATDARRLETLEILASLFPASPRGAPTTAAFADLESAASRLSSLASAAGARRGAVAKVGARFAGQLAAESAKRLEARRDAPGLSAVGGRLAGAGAGALGQLAASIDDAVGGPTSARRLGP